MKRKRPPAPVATKIAAKTVSHRQRNATLAVATIALSVTFLLVYIDPFSLLLLRRAEIALDKGEYSNAQRLADRILEQDPFSSRALLIASSAAEGQQRFDQAMEYLERIIDEGNENTVTALRRLGDYASRLGYTANAEAYLRRALQYSPEDLATRESLISLMVRYGRMWEAQELILPLMKQGQVDANHLIVVSSPDIWLADNSQFTSLSLAAVPDDPLPLLADASQAWRANQWDRAEGLLREIITAHPENIEARAQLGRILAEASDPAPFLFWRKSLPESATEHPLIWFAWGRWAQQQNQLTAAARCFWETLVRQPNHTAANYQLSQVLIGLGQTEQAKAFSGRAEKLAKLYLLIDGVKADLSLEKIQALIGLLETLGRPREASGWCEVVLREKPDTVWASTALHRLRKQYNPSSGFTLDSYNPALQFDLSRYPLPRWELGNATDKDSKEEGENTGLIQFEDLASAAGIDFSYQNGASNDGFETLFEMNGGGVAILDYDNDGWPDIYMTQGGQLPPMRERSSPTNRLFRNLGNGTFQDMTTQSGLGDRGYGQGVTVGDFDNDGFPDLYIANIGPNVLFHNNGDGTFSDVTTEMGVAGSDWTSSCLIADLNGDTYPDLYVVNYIGGDDLLGAVCKKHAGRRCAPVDFPAAQDRIYLNLGNGRFDEVTDQSGIVASGGRGLGIVAADLDGSRRLSLYVANDMSANFLFTNQTPTPGASPLFSERGLLSGLGLSSQGIAQAGMGIAAGDANGDGLLDLFVTNFYQEPNNLYVQQSDRLFQDRARPANLWDAGFAMLGWGTQFLDADLDGYADLIVANGHVHDPVDPQVPYQMPPQFFRNLGSGQFLLQPAETLGKYFQGKYLGRAVARLDWNRDGLDDVCIMHLDSPVALLTNQTKQRGNHLSLSLVGTASDRDAIGTSVRATFGQHTSVHQLIAGDGYQASNQRQLNIGVGESKVVNRIEIVWPSGKTQVFVNIPVDNAFLVIEGEEQLISQPR
ncbi:MAG TPA: hypothetical protein DDZ51_27950 [Planctomycetaceae bacterium]|nr:hypothetical protein [Planctomycetaceae bacterium]